MRRIGMALMSIVVVVLISVPGTREAIFSPALAQSRALASAPQDTASSLSEPDSLEVAETVSSLEKFEESENAVTLAVSAPSAELAAAANQKNEKNGKVVYLTFDDGPSKLTDDILSILEEEKVQATFFVLGQQAQKSPEILYRTAEAGHAIGNHTYNHKYSELYESFTAFWNQIKRTEEIIREVTGTRTSLVRAPGGTYGHFDATYFQLMDQAGYQVFDWNVDSGDSKRKGVPADEIISNVTTEKLKQEMIVLLHDSAGHEESVKALPDIISFYKKQGYSFEVLSPEQKPVQFTLSKNVPVKPEPTNSWIESHVLPNIALFGPGQPLIVEAGGVQTKLAPGEYEVSQGQLIVPLRTAMERLGAEVSWDGETRNVVIVWGEVYLTLDPRKGTASQGGSGIPINIGNDRFTSKGGSLWMSLRPLLELTGHPITSVTSNMEERRVQSL